jgi:hypothetical protein
LALDSAHDGASVGVKTVFRTVIANAADGFTDQGVVIDLRGGGDFAGHHGQAGGDQRLAADAALGILPEDFIEYGVGNLVGYLVGVTFGDGFRRKQEVS